MDFAAQPAEPSAGDFDGIIDAAGLPPGRYDVWARACLGQTCGTASTPLRIGPPPTTIAFTDRSMRRGQHSDIAVVEASLTDERGQPVTGAAVTFELDGPDGARTVDATTDTGGLAAAALTLTERPGDYQLTVRYPGLGTTLAGSASIADFTVEHEESVIDLSVTGHGANRTLTASLRDHDAAEGAGGLSGRTVTFAAGGQTLGAVVTDTVGIARFTPPPRTKGPFRATFVGDTWYRSSSDVAG